MVNDISIFKKIVKQNSIEQPQNKKVWGYTRVSSKDQFDNNSLENQKRDIKNFANELGYEVEKYFGETYESASSDFSRKQFSRMFAELKSAKTKPYAIMVFKMNRFSRTGMNGIGLLNELVNKYGVHLIEVSSKTSTDSDDEQLSLMQSLIDARKENISRMQTTIPGMKSFLRNGNWLGKAPRGYAHFGSRVKDYGKLQPKQKIILNEEGQKLRDAWYWKAEGKSDAEIIKMLSELDISVSKQFISGMWRKPFYCGILVHKLLDYEPVLGNWEAMIPRELFLEVQEIIDGKRNAYKQTKNNSKFPLAGFIYCPKCNNQLTHYTVKKKNLDYYTCNYCKDMNINANTTVKAKRKGAHDLFNDLLKNYSLDNTYLQLFEKQLEITFSYMNRNNIELQEKVTKQISVLQEEKESMTAKYARGKLKEEHFKIGNADIESELDELKSKLNKVDLNLSNQDEYIRDSLEICTKINELWEKGDYSVKRRVQSLMFPEGIILNKEKNEYLTKKTNSIFILLQQIQSKIAENKKGLTSEITNKSFVVDCTNELSNQFYSDFISLVNFTLFLKSIKRAS